jgi:hypothetical protein
MNMMAITKLPVRPSGMPTDNEILAIPKARTGEYQLSDAEMKKLRSRIYALNKDNAANRRWRTMREGDLLIVWRIK